MVAKVRKTTGVGLRPKSASTRALAELIEEASYTPTEQQAKAKAAFWAVAADNPALAETTGTNIARITGVSKFPQWWSDPSFRAWFLNKEEFIQKAEYAAMVALDTLIMIMKDDTCGDAARVNASKAAIEVANKLPQRTQRERWHDEDVGNMTPQQLEAYLASRGVSIDIHEPPIQVTPSKGDDTDD